MSKPASASENVIKLLLGSSLGSITRRSSECLSCGCDVVGSSGCPNPVCDGEVDKCHPQQHEQHDRRELHTLCERADNESRRDHGERHLEHHVGIFRNDDAVGEGWHVGGGCNASQHDFAKTADVGSVRTARVAQRNRVSIEAPQDADHRHDHEHLGQHRKHILRAYQAAVEQGETGDRHHKNECRGNKHPRRIARIGLGRWRRGVGGQGHPGHQH